MRNGLMTAFAFVADLQQYKHSKWLEEKEAIVPVRRPVKPNQQSVLLSVHLHSNCKKTYKRQVLDAHGAESEFLLRPTIGTDCVARQPGQFLDGRFRLHCT